MILFCFGTRPEWLKLKPIVRLLDKSQYKLLFTGQHPDLLKDLMVDYRIAINESDNRLDQLISDCITQFPKGDFDSVLVQGDTASAFACALAAFNRQLKIYYLEAGLRSYDMQHPYPEEAYRQMISRISDVNFCPTSLSKNNLEEEKVNGTIHVTGNTALDNLVNLKSQCEYLDKVLITLHRRENHFWLDQWFIKLEKLAEDNPNTEFILPIHPNPNVQKHRHLLKKVKVIEPLSHEDLLNILVKCKLIISDSGGLQEEGSFFNKKVIVCRKVTERPEAKITGHLHMCYSPDHLIELFNNLIQDHYIDNECPYGDGYSASKVISYINLK
jgi:UDP-N-acetylglucosamine 2-epimerase (non-hydrolysing)